MASASSSIDRSSALGSVNESATMQSCGPTVLDRSILGQMWTSHLMLIKLTFAKLQPLQPPPGDWSMPYAQYKPECSAPAGNKDTAVASPCFDNIERNSDSNVLDAKHEKTFLQATSLVRQLFVGEFESFGNMLSVSVLDPIFARIAKVESRMLEFNAKLQTQIQMCNNFLPREDSDTCDLALQHDSTFATDDTGIKCSPLTGNSDTVFGPSCVYEIGTVSSCSICNCPLQHFCSASFPFCSFCHTQCVVQGRRSRRLFTTQRTFSGDDSCSSLHSWYCDRCGDPSQSDWPLIDSEFYENLCPTCHSGLSLPFSCDDPLPCTHSLAFWNN